jgi:dihydroflavonol-4-reductase
VRGEGVDRSLADLPVELVRGDITQPESVPPAMNSVDVVIHSAGQVHLGWSQMELMKRVNVEGTLCIARAARAAGVKMIHVSSVDALGLGTRQNPANEETTTDSAEIVDCPYVITKRAAESAVDLEIEQGLDAVIVNPVFMLGPWDWKPSSGRMLLEVSRGWARLAPPGGNDFADVRDVAAGILSAVERGKTGRRYILGGHPQSYLEAWRLFADVSGATPPKGNCPNFILSIAGMFGDLAYRIRGKEPDVNSAAIKMAKIQHHYTYERAASELNYSCRPLHDTAVDTWEWFCKFGYARSRKNGK